jgi:hypothetical protein
MIDEANRVQPTLIFYSYGYDRISLRSVDKPWLYSTLANQIYLSLGKELLDNDPMELFTKCKLERLGRFWLVKLFSGLVMSSSEIRLFADRGSSEVSRLP